MVNEDAALLNRPVTHMTPAALFNRRLHIFLDPDKIFSSSLYLVAPVRCTLRSND
jgi:hypothetical protein